MVTAAKNPTVYGLFSSSDVTRCVVHFTAAYCDDMSLLQTECSLPFVSSVDHERHNDCHISSVLLYRVVQAENVAGTCLKCCHQRYRRLCKYAEELFRKVLEQCCNCRCSNCQSWCNSVAVSSASLSSLTVCVVMLCWRELRTDNNVGITEWSQPCWLCYR